MFNRKIYLFLLLLCIPQVKADNIIKRAVKQWVHRAFGIDVNEPLKGEPFNPTIANLNTITLIPSEEPNIETAVSLSVSELAHLIDENGLIQDETYLSLVSGDQTKYWQVYSGIEQIKEDETVFVYSRGYAGAEKPAQGGRKERGLCSIPKNGGSVVVGSQWLKSGIINGPCVFFDYPDTRSYFDFGLTSDQKCLECIHTEICKKTKNIVFFGNCRGSKALLTYLSRSQPTDVRAVILDAPFLDLDQFVTEIRRNYGKFLPFSDKIAKKIITTWYPNYKAQMDLAVEELKYIPVHIPIFIGHLKNDTLVSDRMIQNMVKVLRDSGHIVYLLAIDDKTKSHSRLYQTKPFAQAVNAFLKKYNLPHDAKLAQEGKKLLSQAHYTAKFIDQWKIPFLHVTKA